MKQALTESGENGFDMESKSKHQMTKPKGLVPQMLSKLITVMAINNFDDYSRIKKEPTGSDENEEAVKHTDDDNNYNDEHDSILPRSRYPPSLTFSSSPPPFRLRQILSHFLPIPAMWRIKS